MAPVWATQQLGIRKGAWTPEEDALLTKCIDKYGEGKWRHVPLRAGLNRCRKSCRLRWLNYLRPSIKRGEFAPDEVDLIIKLHRLLGSRWSLIAGRIPGRTANDIKNYWNCHLRKKLAAENDQGRTSKVIKPKPRTLAVKSGGLMGCHGAFPNASSKQVHMDDKSNPIVSDNDLDWWKRLIDEESRNLGSPNAYGEQLKASPQAEDKGGMASDGDPYAFLEGEIDWDGLFLDVDLRGSLEANGEGTAI